MQTKRFQPRALLVLVAAVLFALLVVTARTVPHSYADDADLTVYADALAPGWEDWSWDSAVDVANAAPVYSGAASIAVTYDAAWAGFSLRTPDLIDAHAYQSIEFLIYAGDGGAQLDFAIQTDDVGGLSDAVTVHAPANAWTQVRIALTDLGDPGVIQRLNWQDATGAVQPTFYLDDIRFIDVNATPTLVADTPTPTPVATEAPIAGHITIDARAADTPFDAANMTGTNLAAWINAPLMASDTLRARTMAAGNGLVRIPGGAWSQEYGWLSCEMGNDVAGAHPCREPSDARLTDFLDFLRATNRPAMYTININTTPQEAAAVVAFFNATENDDTVIGVDSRGMDWRTAGTWASLRAERGFPEPFYIHYWDFGNETYGGVPDAHPSCQEFGWEAVWTCDGGEYIDGADGHAGYLAFRAAMRAVDPTIAVGVVGYHTADGYDGWTRDLLTTLKASGGVMDFFTVHPYTFDFFPSAPPSNPATYAEFLARPQTQWREIRQALDAAFAEYGDGDAVPVWVTEYNLTASSNKDTDQLTTRWVTGLFMADTVGQILSNGFAGALQWDLVNGQDQGTGADLAMLRLDFNEATHDFARRAQYWPYVLWSRFGDVLLPVTSGFDPATELSVYAGRAEDNVVSLLAVNKSGAPLAAVIDVQGVTMMEALVDTAQAADLRATTVSFNGVADPADDLSDAPFAVVDIAAQPGAFVRTFPAYSVTLLRIITTREEPDPEGHAVFLPHLAR
ncbi:MAG: hypothetical protein KDD83_11255 [Caldilineaceae bacterium]|nr:hypothetical protein [Caldilineaceae bacterium]